MAGSTGEGSGGRSIGKLLGIGWAAVTLPIFPSMFAPPVGFGVVAAKYYGNSPWLLFWGAIGFLLGLALAWGYWSVAVVRWRVWAFRQNPKSKWRELRHRAIEMQLI